jgi:hypothetical protein
MELQSNGCKWYFSLELTFSVAVSREGNRLQALLDAFKTVLG